MIILIGNQKGGAGKSTFTMLLANYLTLSRHCKVTVIDMDYQQSIVQKYQRAKLLENAEPYEVIAASLETYPHMLKVLNENQDDLVLIDLPGKLDDDGLIPVFNPRTWCSARSLTTNSALNLPYCFLWCCKRLTRSPGHFYPELD